MNAAPLAARFGVLERRLAALHGARPVDRADVEASLSLVVEANHAGRADLSLALLEPLRALVPHDAEICFLLGLSYRDLQRMDAAVAALDAAAVLAPRDGRIAFARAQLAFETGWPSAALFQAAQVLAPDNAEINRTAASALAADGKAEAGISLLARTVAQHPDWLEGHKTLTSLRATAGDPDCARSYAEAVRKQPQNLKLYLAWFQAMALTQEWDAAAQIIAAAARDCGERPALSYARLYLVSESGAGADDPALFDAVVHVRDPGLDLAHIRHAVRLGQLERAEAIGLRHLGTPMQNAFWPYLSLVWRLRGDLRAAWLDGDDAFIKSYDLEFTADELAMLADDLRGLHTMRAPYLEQSVRGGTQTDGQLFFRNIASIQAVRAKVLAAVQRYVAALPPPDATHPLLSAPRGRTPIFEGSWSVRLSAQGFHVCHTHTHGWISSALYVSLPPSAAMGAPPAGWISFGTPPPALGLSLAPYCRIAPKPGRLVLFPSTMWHCTEPFDDGERLVIAFDVRRPRS